MHKSTKRACILSVILVSGIAGTCEKGGPEQPQQAAFTKGQHIDQVRMAYFTGEKAKITRITYWDSILAEARRHDLSLFECRILGKIGGIYSARGDMSKAIAAHTDGLNIAEQKGYKAEVLDRLKSIGGLYASKFDRTRSLYFAYKGLRIAEELKDKRAITDFYSLIAQYYLTSGEVNKALNIHLRCLKTSREMGYDFGISSALVDIGSDYVALHETGKAFFYYMESKNYADRFPGTRYAAEIYNCVGYAYMSRKQYDSAYYYTYKAYKIVEQLHFSAGIMGCLTTLTGHHYDMGNNRAAKATALRALKLVQAAGFTAQLPDLLKLLKNIYVKEGNYKKALEVFDLYVNIRDSLSNEKVRKQALEKEFSYNLEKKENEYKLLAQENRIQDLQLNRNQYLLFGLGCLLLIVLIITYMVIRQNRLRTEHQRMQLEHKLLRSLMKPHFVFNSMNAIQQLIMSDQNSQAELYLSKFSKLTRDILESNIKEGITLSEEVDMLHAYLEIESLRFGAAFSYSVRVDPEIDAPCTSIPYLMVQPFVENAIWHGLLAKSGDKNLQVTFTSDTGKTIRCMIDDNGIGREESMKKEKPFKKNSLALDIAEQRMQLIRQAYKIKGGISFIDKKDEHGRSMGTRVEIILPILKT